MNAYAPHDLRVIPALVALLATILLLGRALSTSLPHPSRPAAWALALLSVPLSERLTAHEPPGLRMIAIIATLLLAMKSVVAVEALKQGSPPLTFFRWLTFAALWPGMRPGPFSRARPAPLPGVYALARMGLVRLAAGAALIAAARLAWTSAHSRLLATVLLLPGLSLVVHFGLFNIIAAAWRHAGVDVKPLFRAPLLSTSLGEFWGRRWNLAFSEMTALAIYQPLARRAGRRPALAASFLASGVLHELAISLPVLAGFGLPLAYFALHGALMTLEARLARSGHPIDRNPHLGRAWTLAWILLPLPILFHPPFLNGVARPLIGIPP